MSTELGNKIMALKKPTPAFENENDGVATVTEDAKTAAVAQVMGDEPENKGPAADEKGHEEPTTPATPAAKVEATTAVAKASAGSMAMAEAAASAKALKREIEEMRGGADFAYGNFPVFKGSNGSIRGEMGGAKVDLGRWVQIRLMAWDDHFEISPGEQGASTKEFVAYSKDGQTIDSVIGEENKGWEGKPVQEYLHYLKTVEEFTRAKVRRFLDMSCAVLGADGSDAATGQIIQITLSESSIPSFQSYQQDLTQKAKAVAMGLPGFVLPEDPLKFYFIREVATKGDNEWTKLRVASTLPAKL
jgi:hypothetical protein